MDAKVKTEVKQEEIGMSFADIRRAICGEMEFTISINQNVEMTFRELTQEELNKIDNELDVRGISQYNQYSPEDQKKIESGEKQAELISKEYRNTQRVLKLAWAFKKMAINGKVVKFNDEKGQIINNEIEARKCAEKLIMELGEGVWTGLFLQYEGIVSQKFLEVKKK